MWWRSTEAMRECLWSTVSGIHCHLLFTFSLNLCFLLFLRTCPVTPAHFWSFETMEVCVSDCFSVINSYFYIFSLSFPFSLLSCHSRSFLVLGDDMSVCVELFLFYIFVLFLSFHAVLSNLSSVLFSSLFPVHSQPSLTFFLSLTSIQ